MRIRISLFAKSLLMILLMEPPMVVRGRSATRREIPFDQLINDARARQLIFFLAQKGVCVVSVCGNFLVDQSTPPLKGCPTDSDDQQQMQRELCQLQLNGEMKRRAPSDI
jgi:hypothetical protein